MDTKVGRTVDSRNAKNPFRFPYFQTRRLIQAAFVLTKHNSDGNLEPVKLTIYLEEKNMRRIGVFSLMLLIFMVMPALGAEDGNTPCDAACLKLRQIYEQKNVVHVIAIGTKGIGNGTGSILREGILTNNHVVEGALKISVEFHGVPGYHDVTIIGRDPASDQAILTLPTLPPGVTSVSLGDSLKVGDRVYALGYPFGKRSVTLGYVNTLESISWLYAWTQTPIAPGNSGGPLFNENGQMVGLNTAIVPVVGVLISYTLPVQHVKRIFPRLSRERVVRHGAAGFGFGDASQILPVFLEQMGLPYPPERGVMVVGVPPNSPPDRAGIRQGDYILKFNGSLVKSALELEKKIFFDHRPDDEVEIELKRGRQVFVKKFLLSEYASPLGRNNKEK